MKNLLLRSVLILLIGLLTLAGASAESKKSNGHFSDLVITAISESGDSKEMSLSDFEGKPILLEAWASWCAPCLAALPHLDQIMKDFPDVQVVPVSVDEGGVEAVVSAYHRTGVTGLPVYLDKHDNMSLHLGVRMYPTTLLFDSCGQLVFRKVGGRSDSYKILRQSIERLRGAKCSVPGL